MQAYLISHLFLLLLLVCSNKAFLTLSLPTSQSTRPQPVVTTSRPKVEPADDFNDYEYQSLDYDYYYDQLVPEHERFFQVFNFTHN